MKEVPDSLNIVR